MRTTPCPYYRYAQRIDEATECLSRLQTSDRPSTYQGAARFIECCINGLRDEAMETIRPEWIDYMWEDEDFTSHVSACLTMIGENDRALDWLERTTIR